VQGSSERDQSIERLLRQTLKTPTRDGVTGACLDAETLAAWTEGGLSGGALDAAQLHVADCSRCQDLVGTLARITTTVPAPEPVRVSRRWLAWFVPLTAAAAAAALWVVLPGNDARNALIKSTPSLQSQLKNQVADRQAQESPALGGLDGAVGGAVAPQAGKAPPPLGPSTTPQPAVAPDAASKDTARSSEAKEKVEAGNSTALGRLEADDLRKAFTPPAAPPAAASPAPPPAAAAASSTLAAESSLRRSRFGARADAATTEIVSPDPAVRWRVLGSALEHSGNGGTTWEPVSTGFAAELTAGAAPSATICWLVGRRGVVLLTTDGRTWRRVAFPEMTDLSGVFTVDAGGNVASVSTVDGRTFVTTDAGATWASR
jgi:hypothetical protein